MIVIQDLALPGVKLISPKFFEDERGFFMECYRQPSYQELGLDCEFVQDNLSFSRQGTIRGMHFQMSKTSAQSKLLTLLEGEIFDVWVDINPKSPHFGKWEGIVLKAEERKQLFIPGGYAHGFAVLSQTATLLYKASQVYDAALERNFFYADPQVNIAWPFAPAFVSSRDAAAPFLAQVIQ